MAAHVPGLLYQFELQPDGGLRFVYASGQALPGLPEPWSGLCDRDATDLLAAVVAEDRAGLIGSVRDSARLLNPWQHEFRVRLPEGRLRWLHGSASPQAESDGRIVWCGYLQDVSDRHELAAAREQAEQAVAASSAKSAFLSRMSHELRTPLNAVLGFAQLMEIDESDPPSASQLRRLQYIRDAGDHLLQMIGELLDLTRIETGSLALVIEAVPLRALAIEAVSMVQPAADQAQVRLQMQLDGAPLVQADRTRLRQVLINLLSNAVKYNRAGGRVDLALEPAQNGQVCLQVRDDGQGIAEADLPRLFEPFHRGRHAGGPIEGTGIGLSLSRSLVQLMGGRIDVVSVVGTGSVFSVSLPGA